MLLSGKTENVKILQPRIIGALMWACWSTLMKIKQPKIYQRKIYADENFQIYDITLTYMYALRLDNATRQ